LIREDLDVRWYIIGFGGDEALIRQRIHEAGMEKRVILLGKKENPYPYIKACDLYVQPSRYEGKCVAVREAQLLCKPVVITNYATSASQLENGVDGVIAPMDNKGCATEIIALLRNPERMRWLADGCKSRDYTNSEEVEKVYTLL
jgi:glycosyltransferase involved in cell wall biosynthesis